MLNISGHDYKSLFSRFFAFLTFKSEKIKVLVLESYPGPPRWSPTGRDACLCISYYLMYLYLTLSQITGSVRVGSIRLDTVYDDLTCCSYQFGKVVLPEGTLLRPGASTNRPRLVGIVQVFLVQLEVLLAVWCV